MFCRHEAAYRSVHTQIGAKKRTSRLLARKSETIAIFHGFFVTEFNDDRAAVG
jgi:hypothetical protein